MSKARIELDKAMINFIVVTISIFVCFIGIVWIMNCSKLLDSHIIDNFNQTILLFIWFQRRFRQQIIIVAHK